MGRRNANVFPLPVLAIPGEMVKNGKKSSTFLPQNSRISTRNIREMRDIKGVELLIYTDILCVMVSISVCKVCVLTHSHEKGISFTSLIIPLTYNLRRAWTSFQSFPKTRLAVIGLLAWLAFHRTLLYDTISKQKSCHFFLANQESWLAFTSFYERGAGFMWLPQVLIGLLDRETFLSPGTARQYDWQKKKWHLSQSGVSLACTCLPFTRLVSVTCDCFKFWSVYYRDLPLVRHCYTIWLTEKASDTSAKMERNKHHC